MSSTSNIPLSYTLAKLAHLNLSGYIQYTNALARHGGYCNVFIRTMSIASKGLLENSQEGAEIKVAVKRLRVHTRQERGFENILAKELYIWSKLKHANILPLQGFILENGFPLVISEWMKNGTVREYLQKNPTCKIEKIILGIANGLNHLHRGNIVHSDLKPDNVLVNHSGQPLICDFGMSRMLFATASFAVHTSGGGTLRWMARELLNGGQHTEKSDVWAFGMTVYEMLTKDKPYADIKSDILVMPAILNGRLPLDPCDLDSWTPYLQSVWNICQECWKWPAKNRISMEEAVNRLVKAGGCQAETAPVNLINTNSLMVASHGLQVQVHNLLREATFEVQVHLDLALQTCECLIASDNSAGPIKMTTYQLDLPATEPKNTVIKLICPALGEKFAHAWKIEIKRPDSRNVTIANVLAETHKQLRKQFTKDQWTSLSDSEAHIVGQQYQRRCAEAKNRFSHDPDSYKYEEAATRRGLRVDFLGNKHWFAGLRQFMSNDPFEFELLVKEV